MDISRLKALPGWPDSIRHFPSIDSTNTYAKAWARQGAPHGALVLADRQTAGRGRLGRQFFSPQGGLYMSLILDSRAALPGQLTTLAAVAVREAVALVTGQQLGIKWVNDLLLDGRKVCGILAEGIVMEGRLGRSVIGIGINTGPVQLPEELRHSAGSLYVEGQLVDREALCQAIALNIILEGLPHIPAHMDSYRAHCLTLGQAVCFQHQGSSRQGIARAIDDAGGLWLDTQEGPLHLVAGEVSLLPAGPAGADR